MRHPRCWRWDRVSWTVWSCRPACVCWPTSCTQSRLSWAAVQSTCTPHWKFQSIWSWCTGAIPRWFPASFVLCSLIICLSIWVLQLLCLCPRCVLAFNYNYAPVHFVSQVLYTYQQYPSYFCHWARLSSWLFQNLYSSQSCRVTNPTCTPTY